MDKKEFKKPKRELKFLFPSYRALMDDLGRLDEATALMSTSSIGFIFEAFLSGDVQRYIRNRLTFFTMNTNFSLFPDILPMIVRFSIVGTFQNADAFFDDFRREHRAMGLEWPERDKTPPLDYVLQNIGPTCGTKRTRQLKNLEAIQEHRYRIFQYYKELRDIFVHEPNNLKRSKQAFAEVEALQDVVREGFGLEAPNHYDSLTYDDYLLFTRVVKYVSASLCGIAIPTESDYFVGILGSAVNRKHFKSVLPTRKLLASRHNPTQCAEELILWFENNFGYDIGTNHKALKACVIFLGEVPNRKLRKLAKSGRLDQGLWTKD